MEAHLCKCYQCDNILIDESPQVDTPLYNLSDYPNALKMDKAKDEDGVWWRCPVCKTDAYLIDNLNA